ncbi:MAG: HAD family hydrolase [Treponema sp.]|jgi:putative hydrolase of the HAD superfamily|nr:HAD family hydrolase [Treponema sp.]
MEYRGAKNYLVDLIRAASPPLEAIPALLPEQWVVCDAVPLDGLRAVLFDLYGTLFISAAGDMASASGGKKEPNAKNKTLAVMDDYFHAEVKKRHNEARAAGIDWPEVNAEEIWSNYHGPFFSGDHNARETALRYELAVNPVYPMPGAENAIRFLKKRGMTLGIISNAQFYSALLFDAFFNTPPEEMGFDSELLVYSFKAGVAKPSAVLFNTALAVLAKRGIRPAEALYVGNDMRNDIRGAADCGMKTCLFAGDSRSLRLRPGQHGDPDYIVRNLEALTSYITPPL